VADLERVEISFGHRALTMLGVGVAALGALSLCILAIGSAVSSSVPGAFRVQFGILGAIAVAGVAGLAVVLARSPRLLSRTILVTPSMALLPVRRFRPIPIAEIAGVGLVLQRNPRNGLPGGNWALAIWRQDGSIAYTGGLQRRAQIKDPTHSRIADAARQLHDVVRSRQGPDGVLSRRHLQRHATWGEYRRYGVYVCQPERSFRGGLTHFGFYAESVIQPLIARIGTRHIAVPFTRDEATRQRADSEPELGDLIDLLLDKGKRTEGESYDVLFLSRPDDAQTGCWPRSRMTP
jgi:hypothetical protein